MFPTEEHAKATLANLGYKTVTSHFCIHAYPNNEHKTTPDDLTKVREAFNAYPLAVYLSYGVVAVYIAA